MSRLSRLPFLSANRSKQVFKRACEKYDLVYFGNVSQRTDDHQMVRGFTLSPTHVDRHYCVGTVSHRDVILLERTDTISFPDKPSKSFTWVILQVDLKHKVPYRALLNSFRYDEDVYSKLFTRLTNLQKIHASHFGVYEKTFQSHYTVYMSMQHSHEFPELIHPDAADVIGHHFHGIDFELLDDALIVYYPTITPHAKMIEHVFKAGIWLAGEIDGVLERKIQLDSNN